MSVIGDRPENLRPLRILHVVPSYLPATRYGGPIYSVHGLCKALAALGHEVHVFTTNVDGPNDSAVPLGQPVGMDGVKIWYFPSRHLRRLFFAPGMTRALKSQLTDFDIVHLHSVFLWPTWAAARAARKAGVPYIIAPRGMLVLELIRRKSHWLKTLWIRFIERRNLQQAAGIHVTSSKEQQELAKFGFDLPRCFYVPNGVDAVDKAELTPAVSGQKPDAPFALFLGRINWKKGLDRLVEAWRDVPDLELIIAGNDEKRYQAEIEKLAESLGVQRRVHFTGPVTGRDKWLLFQKAEVFVLPSYSENFGIAVLEAMLMACPVIVTPEVGLAAVVEEVECGLVVDGKPWSIAEAVNSLQGDPERRAAMGRRGRQAAKDRFLWSNIARQMEQVYLQVAASGVT